MHEQQLFENWFVHDLPIEDYQSNTYPTYERRINDFFSFLDSSIYLQQNTLLIKEEAVLTDNELRLVWQSLNGGDYATIVKLLMLTGQRLDEIAALSWQELNIADAIISLPGSSTKNRGSHEVPLAATARSLLVARKQNGHAQVFGEHGYSGFSAPKLRLDKRIAELNGGTPIPPWVIHDIRRSVVTGMAKLGIAPHIIECVVNHVSGFKRGVAGVYNKNQYAPEKAEALRKWDAHIASITGT